jgi:hypothetical protein
MAMILKAAYSSSQKFCPIVGWVLAADTERWDRLPACLFMNDGQNARRHQILFFFAFIFENPYNALYLVSFLVQRLTPTEMR